jgi:small subunit ribosomal protein S3
LGQKVHPVGLRLGISRTWNSRWFASKDYASQLHEDIRVRRYIKEHLSHAGVSRIELERAAKRLRINIHTARPGIIIGKKGAEIDKLMKTLQEMTSKEVFINIMEVRKPEIDAQLVAENIALQLERRVSFRRAMKRSVLSAIRFGAEGVKIMCAGRLAGHEIARSEWYREGRVPLHTLRADIEYGLAEAKTTYGVIGVKVWVFRGMKDLLGATARAEATK